MIALGRVCLFYLLFNVGLSFYVDAMQMQPGWDCRKCTFRNQDVFQSNKYPDVSVSECAACGTLKTQGPVVPPAKAAKAARPILGMVPPAKVGMEAAAKAAPKPPGAASKPPKAGSKPPAVKSVGPPMKVPNQGFNTAVLALYRKTFKNTKTFIPPVKGRPLMVIKVYDGDTITIATQFPDDQNQVIYKFPVRLLGIDCPEISVSQKKLDGMKKSAAKTKLINQKKMAEEAKKYVTNRILDKAIYLDNIDTDKYGRLLAHVFPVDREGWKMKKSISAELLEQGLAYEYFGDTKKCPDDWYIFYQKKQKAIKGKPKEAPEKDSDFKYELVDGQV